MNATDTVPDLRFHAACGSGPDWGRAVKDCLTKLGDVTGCNFGLLYVSDALAADATSIVTLLRGVTGIRDWAGTVGLGVLGGGEELFDQPAVAVMAARLPEEGFRLFPAIDGDLEPMRRVAGGWLDRHGAALALVHADPRNQRLTDLVATLADTTGAFLVGGLTSSRGDQFPQFTVPGSTATGTEGPVSGGGLSGVLFAPDVAVAVGHSQGCTPIGPARTITAAEDNVIIEIEGRPALEVFKQDIGEALAHDLRQVAGTIFAGLPVAGSDTGDYMARDLVAIDPRAGWIAIGERVQAGQTVLFARRDRESAEADLSRMLAKLKKRLNGPPKGGVYVSCIARGPNLFGADSEEVRAIHRELGDFPLVGFFAAGEISHNRLYGYTGVLTLFV